MRAESRAKGLKKKKLFIWPEKYCKTGAKEDVVVEQIIGSKEMLRTLHTSNVKDRLKTFQEISNHTHCRFKSVERKRILPRVA